MHGSVGALSESGKTWCGGDGEGGSDGRQRKDYGERAEDMLNLRKKTELQQVFDFAGAQGRRETCTFGNGSVGCGFL